DPTIITSSSQSPRGDLMATVNFRRQVGYSRFEVVVDNIPELEFEVEVFPTKIDYKSDYDAMVAEISAFYRGLVLEYMRGTFRLGQVVRVPDPSHIEWLTILKEVLDQLERALRHIAHQPRRRLTRTL